MSFDSDAPKAFPIRLEPLQSTRIIAEMINTMLFKKALDEAALRAQRQIYGSGLPHLLAKGGEQVVL